MTADFHRERQMVTSMARADKCWTEDEIRDLRRELRDQYYAKLKYANRPLPPPPSIGSLSSPSTMSGKTVVDPGESEASKIRALLKDETYKGLEKVCKPVPDESFL